MRGVTLTIATAFGVFILDQALKLYVVHILDLPNVLERDVFAPYLVLRMAWNTGINFGLFAQYGEALRWGLIALALIISAWLLWWMWKDKAGPMAQVSAGLVVGGALGNVIDRVIYGAVADFLNMSCCGFENPYSFNVADIAIFVGALGLILFTGDNSRDAADKGG